MSVLDQLASQFGDRASMSQTERDAHFRDAGYQGLPLSGGADLVVYPESTAEVQTIVRFANQHRIPVVPWGAGTSLEGNPIPIQGGIVVDMNRMNKVLDIQPQDLQVTVQPGVTHFTLNSASHLGAHGLFFPPDPGADATIGGMVANAASGTKSVKYGVTRDYVQALEIVTPTGEVIRTGTLAPKTSSGYDLRSLLVGSEGTLGIATEITLRVAGIPQVRLNAVAYFDALAAASEAVSVTLGSGVKPSMIELLDGPTVRVMDYFTERYDFREGTVLLLELDGPTEQQVEAEFSQLQEIFSACGMTAMDELDRTQAKQVLDHRHELFIHIKQLTDLSAAKLMDVAVPFSKYPPLVTFIRQVLAESELEGYVLGHAGDGNIHVIIMTDPDDPDLWARSVAAEEAIMRKGLELGGTLTGEHGIGLSRKPYIREEHGAAVEVMKQIKQALDPNGIMNPGKIFD